MIHTTTIPTVQPGARLLLHIRNAPHAFTAAQLVEAVRVATAARKHFIEAHGQGWSHGGLFSYGMPADEALHAEFTAAVEWLAYVGHGGWRTVDAARVAWIKGDPL